MKQDEPMFQNDLKRKALFDTLDRCVEEAKATGKIELPKHERQIENLK